MGRIGLGRIYMGLSSAYLGGILSVFLAGSASSAPVNDNFINATVLAGSTNLVTVTNTDATIEAGEPTHANASGGKSVWWSWQAPVTGSVAISTAGSSFDTLLAVYTGETI